MTARQAIMYKITLKYSEAQLSAKHDRLHIINPQNPKIILEQANTYERALNGFVI